jgi:tRNA pseudouridine55 synthase
MNDRSGFLLVNKPVGMTSYSCINHIKRILQKKVKIGHAGTLDPFASGLLIIALGRDATRLLSQAMGLRKTYRAQAQLGQLTDTLDCTGMPINTMQADYITEDMIQQAISSFGVEYEQIPPIYSALKHEGQALYNLVRKQQKTEEELHAIVMQKRRIVHLYSVNLIAYANPSFTIEACVSQGTYIRSLMNDIAGKMGTYATTYELERTAIGPFTLSHAYKIEELCTMNDISNALLDIDFFTSKIVYFQ